MTKNEQILALVNECLEELSHDSGSLTKVIANLQEIKQDLTPKYPKYCRKNAKGEYEVFEKVLKKYPGTPEEFFSQLATGGIKVK